jgi:hypothetical protein
MAVGAPIKRAAVRHTAVDVTSASNASAQTYFGEPDRRTLVIGA